MSQGLPAHVATSCTELLQRVTAAGNLPSLVGAVFAHGRVQCRHDIGAVGSQYRIGSITKTFTAVAVLQLRDAGVLDLADPIGRHLPGAPYPDHAIRDLLAHRSGMTAEPAGPWWERSPGRSWPELARANERSVDVFPPGVRYHYSNLAYGLLGELVARHRSCTWFEAVRDGLLHPLGLDRTTYLPEQSAARGTSRDPRDGTLVEEPAQDTGAMAAAGQLWSTAHDLARWADFLVTGQDNVLADGTSLREMATAHAADPDTQHVGGYGLGLRLRWRSRSTLVGHTGSMPGFLAGLFVDPKTRVGGVVLTNATTGLDSEQVVTALVDLVEPHLASKEQTDRPPDAVHELAGMWYWGNTEQPLTPTADGFRLGKPGEERTFVVDGQDRYRGTSGYFAGETLRVARHADGSVSHLEVVTFVLTRVPYDESAPIPGGPPRPIAD